MKTFILSLFISSLSLTMALCQSVVNCNDDHTFYPANGTRSIPPVNCDTVYLITKRNYKRIFVKQMQDSAILNSTQQEIHLLKKQGDDLQNLISRKDRHIDSLEQYIKEKNKQLKETGTVAKESTGNTQNALRKTRFYKGLSAVAGAVAIISIILLLLK